MPTFSLLVQISVSSNSMLISHVIGMLKNDIGTSGKGAALFTASTAALSKIS